MVSQSPVPLYLNRRDSARSPLYMLVTAPGLPEPIWASDISLGGLRCATRQPLWPGTFLDLAFALPDSHERIEAGGQVVTLDATHAGDLIVGVRFCRIGDGARVAIYRFLDRRRRLWDDGAEDASISEHHPLLQGLLNHPTRLAEMVAEVRTPSTRIVYEN